jgi:protein TonB
MCAALLYRPTQRWQFWAAFGGAVLVHVGAIAIAGIRPAGAQAEFIGGDIEDVVFTELVDPAPLVEPDAPPEPTPPPLPSIEETFIPEEHATAPAARREIAKPPQRVRRVTSARPGGATAIGSIRVLVIAAPPPEYPYEARTQRITGSGIAMLTIDSAGRVVHVTMARSTGHAALDHAAVSGLRRWRFKPGTPSKVQTPVTFTLTGARY